MDPDGWFSRPTICIMYTTYIDGNIVCREGTIKALWTIIWCFHIIIRSCFSRSWPWPQFPMCYPRLSTSTPKGTTPLKSLLQKSLQKSGNRPISKLKSIVQVGIIFRSILYIIKSVLEKSILLLLGVGGGQVNEQTLDNLCGDLNKGYLPLNPIGQLVEGVSYPL